MSLSDGSDLNYAEFMAGPAIEGYDPHPLHMADVLHVHDGDTILARVHFEAGVSVELWLRIADLNTPELHGPHKTLAQEATQALIDLLNQGQVIIRLTGAITFARYVAEISVVIDGKRVDVAERLKTYNVEQGQ